MRLYGNRYSGLKDHDNAEQLQNILTSLYEKPVLMGWSTKIILLFVSQPYSDLSRLKSGLI